MDTINLPNGSRLFAQNKYQKEPMVGQQGREYRQNNAVKYKENKEKVTFL